MDLAGFAAAARGLADRASAGLAKECVQAMAEVALPVLKSVTPVRGGQLRDSETIDVVAGTGAYGIAVIAPHTIYAEFRNNGGTITVKRARVLTDGTSFFGKSVTQKGSHYIERGEAAARGPCEAAARAVADRFFVL